MRYRALITACFSFAFLLAATVGVRAEDPPRCQLMLGTSLPITFDDADAPTVPVTANGKDLKLLVDTGGIYSMLTEGTANQMGLILKSVERGVYYMVSGRMIAHAAVVHPFQIGRITLREYNFMVLPDDEVAPGTAGSLAPDLLSRFDVDFDFGNAKFNLFSQEHCPNKVVYWADDNARLPFTLNDSNQIYTNATLDGAPIKLVVDTGSSVSTMTIERARRLFHWPDNPPDLKPVDDKFSGGRQAYAYPFKTLELNGVTVNSPHILLLKDQIHDSSTDLLLGMSVLRRLHLYIAYREKMLYVTDAAARRARRTEPPPAPSGQ